MSAIETRPSNCVSNLRENSGFHSLMQLAGMLVLALSLVSSAMVSAQDLNPNLVSFVPDPPIADRPFEMVIVVVPCFTGYLFAEGAMVSVVGGLIEVTVQLSPLPVCPPTPTYEIEIPIAPLPAGHYEVRVTGQDRNDPNSLDLLVVTSVDVVAQTHAIAAPTQIPVASPAWLALLGGALLLMGVLRARHSG